MIVGALARRNMLRGADAIPVSNYYPYFDYLRAAAAVGVFVSHADRYHYLPEDFGNACVQLFFALSGFLIGGILVKSGRGDIPRFYFNRAIRIWIPYAIAIAAVAVTTAVKQGFSDPKFGEFFFYMATFVYNWFGPPQLADSRSHMPLDGTANHFWSICVEEQFYLVAPFLLIFCHRLVLLAAMAAATVLSAGYFAAISLGVVMAIAKPTKWFVGIAAALGLIGAAFGSYLISAPLLSAALVGALAVKGSQTTIGKIAGGASYPFYLNHWIGLFTINLWTKIGLPFWAAFALALGVSTAIGVGHYIVIDRTIHERRSKWFSGARGILLCATGLALVTIGFVGALALMQVRAE